MSATGGITTQQIAKHSALLAVEDIYPFPQPVTTTKVVASIDPNGVAVGTALTLQSDVDGKLMRRARRLTVSVTDASGGGGGLSVTVQFVGYRNGALQTEAVTATATSGAEISAATVLAYDQVVSATMISKTLAAGGDALKCGIDGASFGLRRRIRALADVVSIIKIVGSAEAAPTVISTSTVDVANSIIQGLALLAADTYVVQYASTGLDGVGGGGVRG